jgi:hypothetical protein
MDALYLLHSDAELRDQTRCWHAQIQPKVLVYPDSRHVCNSAMRRLLAQVRSVLLAQPLPKDFLRANNVLLQPVRDV